MHPRDEGIVVGLLIAEGHFGGDGRQPQVTLRMHVRHEALLRWLVERFPRSRLYGPYHHGGRHYFQWMARGEALVERPAAGARAPRDARPRRARVRAPDHDDRPLRRRDREAARPRRDRRVSRLDELGRRFGVPPARRRVAARDPRAAGPGPDRADHGARAGRGDGPARGRLARRARPGAGARRPPDRRPRRRRRLAGAGARGRAAGRPRGAGGERGASLPLPGARRRRRPGRQRRGGPRTRGGVAGRARRPRPRHRARRRGAARAVRVRGAAARRRRRAGGVEGRRRGGGGGGGRRGGCPARARAAWRCARSSRTRPPSGGRCTCSRRWRPRRSGSRAGRGWRSKRPLGPE